MVKQTVKENRTRLTHKDGRARKKLVRRNLTVNGTDVKLRRLSNRRRLVVRR